MSEDNFPIREKYTGFINWVTGWIQTINNWRNTGLIIKALHFSHVLVNIFFESRPLVILDLNANKNRLNIDVKQWTANGISLKGIFWNIFYRIIDRTLHEKKKNYMFFIHGSTPLLKPTRASNIYF